MGYHTIPRATQDIDVLVSREDIPRVQRLLQPYYRRGTAVVMVFDVEGTHLDVLPAPYGTGAQPSRTPSIFLCTTSRRKVVSVRDLLLLKLFAIPDRPALDKRRQDEADVTALLSQNADNISQEDITYLVRTLLGTGVHTRGCGEISAADRVAE